jgi:hypothetical protein
MFVGIIDRVDEARQAVSRHTCNKRPLLPNMVETTECVATLQGPYVVIFMRLLCSSFIDSDTWRLYQV